MKRGWFRERIEGKSLVLKGRGERMRKEGDEGNEEKVDFFWFHGLEESEGKRKTGDHME